MPLPDTVLSPLTPCSPDPRLVPPVEIPYGLPSASDEVTPSKVLLYPISGLSDVSVSWNSLPPEPSDQAEEDALPPDAGLNVGFDWEVDLAVGNKVSSVLS